MALFGGIGEVGVWSVRSSCVSENKKARIARDRRPASRVVRGDVVVDFSLYLSLSRVTHLSQTTVRERRHLLGLDGASERRKGDDGEQQHVRCVLHGARGG